MWVKNIVGEKYPAAKISQIDPAKCVDFANVVIVCGTNDLRPTEVREEDPGKYIHELATTIKQKIEDISLLCKANIFLMPVLPTRDRTMNEYIRQFNKLVFNSEVRNRLDFWMPPLYTFLDKQNLLDIKLTRDGDSIHLGSLGLSRLVRVMKDSIYRKEQGVREAQRVVSASVWQRGHLRIPGAGSSRPA